VHELVGHAAKAKTLRALRSWVWHPNLAAVAELHCERCPVCIVVKAKSGPAAAGSGAWRPVTSPSLLHTVSIDKYSFGGSTTFTCMDIFSGFVMFSLLPDASLKTCASVFLNNWCSTLGAPVHVRADNEFRAASFTDMLDSVGTTISYTPPHHPQGNSRLERVHRRLGEILRAEVTLGNRPLNLALISAARQINQCSGPILDLAPVNIMFGGANFPAPQLPAAGLTATNPASRAQADKRRADTINRLKTLARERVLHRLDALDKIPAAARAAAPGARPAPFRKGDLVLKKAPDRTAKDQPKWQTLWSVVECPVGGNPRRARVVQLRADGTASLRVSDQDVANLKFCPGDTAITMLRAGEGKENPNPRQDPNQDQQNDPSLFDINFITSHKFTGRGNNARLSYRIRWADHGPEADSWVKDQDVLAFGEIAKYWKKMDKSKPSEHRRGRA
jgi:hypothetical protein